MTSKTPVQANGGAISTTASHTLTAGEVGSLSMSNLTAVYDVMCASIDALQGMICQPRFDVANGYTLNPAGEILDRMLDHLYACRRMLVETAEIAQPADPREAERRAWLLLHRAASDRDGLAGASALAAQLVARQVKVEFLANHHARAAV